jgi:hypothetical protein
VKAVGIDRLSRPDDGRRRRIRASVVGVSRSLGEQAHLLWLFAPTDGWTQWIRLTEDWTGGDNR